MKCQKNKKCVKSNPNDTLWLIDKRKYCTGCNKIKKDKKK